MRISDWSSDVCSSDLQIAASEWSRTDDEDRNRRPTMDLRPTSGRELRYTLTIVLADVRRTLTVPELLEALNRLGLTAAGRPAKTISDALRWEDRKSTRLNSCH